MNSSPSRKKATPPATVEKYISMLTKGEGVSLDQVIAASPVQIPENPEGQAAAFYKFLYKPEDLIAAVAGEPQAMGKTAPIGGSCVTQAQKLVRYASGGGVEMVFGQYGGYSRINPVKTPKGTGKKGCHCDDDIESFPYVLVESDCVAKPLQLAALCHLRLPIASIVDSGGKSYHALIRIDAQSLEEYRATTARMYDLLVLIGVDHTNKNPSRFTRVPGVQRISECNPRGMQSLLYLCPEPDGTPIVERMAASLPNLNQADV
jgi:hypothetical protein